MLLETWGQVAGPGPEAEILRVLGLRWEWGRVLRGLSLDTTRGSGVEARTGSCKAVKGTSRAGCVVLQLPRAHSHFFHLVWNCGGLEGPHPAATILDTRFSRRRRETALTWPPNPLFLLPCSFSWNLMGREPMTACGAMFSSTLEITKVPWRTQGICFWFYCKGGWKLPELRFWKVPEGLALPKCI